MDEQLITIRLNRNECAALEVLLERLRESYPKVEKVYGEKSKQQFGFVEVLVFQDEFDAVEALDNVLRLKLGYNPYV